MAVYVYVPDINGLCELPNVICDPKYGISLGRGQFTFQPGTWNDLALYIQLNDPSKANGIIQYVPPFLVSGGANPLCT